MTRRLRYSVAASVDGFIATKDGGYDWIIAESAIDFAAYLSTLDPLLRGTWEIARTPEGAGVLEGMKVCVASTTMPADADPRITVVSAKTGNSVDERQVLDGTAECYQLIAEPTKPFESISQKSGVLKVHAAGRTHDLGFEVGKRSFGSSFKEASCQGLVGSCRGTTAAGGGILQVGSEARRSALIQRGAPDVSRDNQVS